MDQNKVQYSKPVPPFVRYCSAIIPTMFDDSLSYYEALCALWKWLQDNLVNVVNQNASVTEYYIQLVNDLKSYVENYFENLDVQEEINNKLDAMVEAGTFQEIIAEYATTKVDYFYIDSETSEADIIAAFASPKSKVIEFENGTYSLTNPIILSSNTTVNLNNATISNPSAVGIFGYALDSTYTDYNGVNNVKISNGTINTCVALMHNSDIKFENITFGNTVTHNIQIASCKNVIVDNCNFSGLAINDELQTMNENIQLEIATRAGQPYLNDEDSVSYDYGYNKNIVISNSTFEGGDEATTRMYSAIGNHSNTVGHEVVADGVKIDNCSFGNSNWATITPCGFINSVIKNCFFNQTNDISWHGLIRFRNINKNVLVENCKFIGGGFAIMSSDMVGYNEEIKIINNYFDSENDLDDSGNIILRNFKNSKISGNTFGKANYYNIYLINNDTYLPQNIDITDNIFDTANIITRNNAIALSRGENVNISCNTFKLHQNKVGVNIGANATDYAIKNNSIISDSVSPRIIYGANVNYENIDGMECDLYTASGSAYSAISNQAFGQSRARFNRLHLVLHKNNDAVVLFDETIYGYSPNDKFSETTARSYPITVNIEGSTKTALFTLNNDGTFSYSSSDNIVLRRIFGYNQN